MGLIIFFFFSFLNMPDSIKTEIITKNEKLSNQIEFYFSDYNLPKDKYLLNLINQNENGWIGLNDLLRFNKVKEISNDLALFFII